MRRPRCVSAAENEELEVLRWARERNAFACIERHQAFALAPVGGR